MSMISFTFSPLITVILMCLQLGAYSASGLGTSLKWAGLVYVHVYDFQHWMN